MLKKQLDIKDQETPEQEITDEELIAAAEEAERTNKVDKN